MHCYILRTLWDWKAFKSCYIYSSRPAQMTKRSRRGIWRKFDIFAVDFVYSSRVDAQQKYTIAQLKSTKSDCLPAPLPAFPTQAKFFKTILCLYQSLLNKCHLVICWCFHGRSEIQIWLDNSKMGDEFQYLVRSMYRQLCISDLPWQHQQTTRWCLFSRLWYWH